MRPSSGSVLGPRQISTTIRTMIRATTTSFTTSDGSGGDSRPSGLTGVTYNRMVVPMQVVPPDFDRMFGALADATRRDIVRRAIDANEGVAQLAAHYPMSFAAVQKHVAILERAGLVAKDRRGRRKLVRANLEAVHAAPRLLDPYEELLRRPVDPISALVGQ